MVEVYETLPIVPLRDVVVFPHMMMPFVIGRPSSIRALEHALGKDKRIFLAAQHDASTDDPRAESSRCSSSTSSCRTTCTTTR
jgi:ATP-dependent Lon protease